MVITYFEERCNGMYVVSRGEENVVSLSNLRSN